LPYIEQQNLFDRFDFTVSPWESPNNQPDLSGPANTVISTYLCPSTARLGNYRGEDFRLFGLPTTGANNKTGTGLACTDYMGIAGPDYNVINKLTGVAYGTEGTAGHHSLTDIDRGVLRKLTSGGFCFGKKNECQSAVVKTQQITDGLSNTMIVAESSGKGTEDQRLSCSDPVNPAGTDEFSGAWAGYRNLSNVDLDPDPEVGDTFCGEYYSAINPPAKLHFRYEEFFSDHPGGVQAGYADGSVHFMADETSRDVYFALCTIDGEEISQLD
jgi:prepilin-type processing-associated H-X9-DG protein